MIAVDTNVLVYAHREDSEWHKAANETVMGLAEGRAPWAIPWPCLHEFFAIVTHPKIYKPPTPLEFTLKQMRAWLESPSLVLLAESAGYWQVVEQLLRNSKINGPQVHDARVAAVCLLHGVRELWSADRDFSRFPNLVVRNPLIPSNSK